MSRDLTHEHIMQVHTRRMSLMVSQSESKIMILSRVVKQMKHEVTD